MLHVDFIYHVYAEGIVLTNTCIISYISIKVILTDSVLRIALNEYRMGT